MTTEERFAKLESTMDRLAERSIALDDALVSLADSQEEQYRLTQKQFREMRREMADLGRETDKRIRALVSAIGAALPGKAPDA
jgi:predicted  nucleic acid-binding Zn-ribbon protein